MTINVYIDESGDQGWILDKPFKKGGSTRYYCCAFLIIPSHKGNLTKEIVQSVYSNWKIKTSRELKGSELTNKMRYFIGEKLAELLSENNEVKIRVVIVKKSVVPKVIVEAPFDLLRNHIVYLGMGQSLNKADSLKFFPDKKPTSKLRENSTKEYLESRMWFDHNHPIRISYEPKDSSENQNLIFIDWISNTCWRYYESNILQGFEALKEHIEFVYLNF